MMVLSLRFSSETPTRLFVPENESNDYNNTVNISNILETLKIDLKCLFKNKVSLWTVVMYIFISVNIINYIPEWGTAAVKVLKTIDA